MAETTADSKSEEIVFKAKLAEQTERYDEMKDCMKDIVTSKKKLSKEERNLLSVAYKNVVGSRRASWRVLHSIQDQSDPEVVAKKALVLQYRTEIENELEEICNDILDLLDKTLLAADEISDEAQVFYYKMKGDYLRYLAEVQTASPAGGDAAPKAKKAYEQAWAAAKPLKATNPIKLGLALNFSVFHYEILSRQDSACTLAKEAFDTAVTELDSLGGSEYKDATLIMQLLRDNLTLWQAEGGPDDEAAAHVDEDGTAVEDM
jgi:hypothetical protein